MIRVPPGTPGTLRRRRDGGGAGAKATRRRQAKANEPVGRPGRVGRGTVEAGVGRGLGGPAAPLDLELGEGVDEGGVDRGHFLVGKLFAEAFLRAPSGFFGPGFVDILGLNGHVGHDGDTLAGDLNEAFADGEMEVLAPFQGHDFTGRDLGEERDVHRVDAHFALHTRQGHHVDILGVDLGFRGDDFEFQRRRHGKDGTTGVE